MNEELNRLREHIDSIDKQMVDLFVERMGVSKDIAAFKKAHQMPTLDAGRERALLSHVAQQAGDEFSDYVQSVYRSIFAAGRSYQNFCNQTPSPIWDIISQAVTNTQNLFPQRASVACQGIEGAYSQIACDIMFKSPNILYFSTFEHVFRAVETGMCQYGVLPVENSSAGSVNVIYDLMAKHNFYIVRSARLKVNHNLLAHHGVKKEDIREIYSHEQALRQSSYYLSGLKDVKITVVENTAVAARMVAESDRTDLAALSSRFCGELYGLNILEANVQDQDNNYTRFICISKQPEIYPGADRTSLMMTLPHKPGALYHILSKFYALGINLRKLESRPIPDQEFEFRFYFDLECPVYAPELQALFRDLEAESEHFRYLGSYSEMIC